MGPTEVVGGSWVPSRSEGALIMWPPPRQQGHAACVSKANSTKMPPLAAAAHLSKRRHRVSRLDDLCARHHGSQSSRTQRRPSCARLLDLLRPLLWALLLPRLRGCWAAQRRAHSLRLKPGTICPCEQRERGLLQHGCYGVWSEAHGAAVAAAHRAVQAQQQLASGAAEAGRQPAVQLGRPQRALHGRPAGTRTAGSR